MKIYFIDPQFKRSPSAYVLQSVLAFVFMTALLMFVQSLTHVAIVVALGASTFLVFTVPHSPMSGPRRLVGGHAVGIITGVASHLVFNDVINLDGGLALAVAYALTVSVAMFLMVITDTEHPPAAATAIGLLVYHWNVPILLFIVLFALSLSLVNWALRRHLRNLF